MKLNLKKLLSRLFIIASIVVVIYIAFSNNELENAWEAIGHMNLLWLLGVLGCWFVYVVFDAMTYWIYLRSQNLHLSLRQAIHVSLIGFYYSNITPSAAGGQPMQVNSLHKAGIPVGYGTMAITVRFICNQTMTVFMTLLFYLFNYQFVQQKLGGVMWIARIGWLINFLAIPLVLLAAFRRDWIQSFCTWIIRLLSKIRIIRNPEHALASVTDVLDTYHIALLDLIKKPGQILIQLLNSAVSMLGLIGSIYFVYHAFGLNGTPWYHLITISFLLFVSASYTPLPGASGAQEGGFLVYFQGIFPSEIIGLALLVWRFFTYYLFLIIGVFTVIFEKRILRINRKKEQQSESMQTSEDP